MRSTCFEYMVLGVLSVFLILGTACSSPTETAPTAQYTPPGDCRDRDCPSGEECIGAGCVPVRPALYPHIQLASALLREYTDFTEIDWRAENYDLLIGRTATYADRLRAGNPNVRLFDYATFRYNFFAHDAEDWAALNGYTYEDFLLHYLEDVNVPGYESTVLVPGYPAGFVRDGIQTRNPMRLRRRRSRVTNRVSLVFRKKSRTRGISRISITKGIAGFSSTRWNG